MLRGESVSDLYLVNCWSLEVVLWVGGPDSFSVISFLFKYIFTIGVPICLSLNFFSIGYISERNV